MQPPLGRARCVCGYVCTKTKRHAGNVIEVAACYSVLVSQERVVLQDMRM